MAGRKNSDSNRPSLNTQEDDMSTTEETVVLGDPDPVELDDNFDDVEEVDEPEEEIDAAETTTEAKAEKEPAKPKRGDLPEGWVTPIQFAKVLGEKGLHTDRDGNVVDEVKPQMVYSYMKNSPKDDRLEPTDIKDSNDVTRSALKLDDALAWWERKNARAAERKANAAEKAKKSAAKAETSKQAAEETDPGAATGQAEEAE
jgi:hypothetical protein